MEKIYKKRMRAACIGTFLVGIIFSVNVFGAELDVQESVEYKKWKQLVTEEKENTLMPKTYSAQIPERVLENNSKKKVPSLVNKLFGNYKLKTTKDSLKDNESAYLDASYHIGNKLNLRVENQGFTEECWAFSMMKSLETNIALRNDIEELSNFSERHMDYATSRTFLDGINEKGFEREVGSGGLYLAGLAYLVNGQGAVLESDMPFENNEEKIELKEIDKEVDTTVTEYITLPSITKEYIKDESGNTMSVIYRDGSGNAYSDEEIENIRNIIKKHIVEDGAIPAITSTGQGKFFNNQDEIKNSTAYNCNDTIYSRDHGVTIVGWDDNYSKENFAEGTRPSKDGAYIILNSYGEEFFNEGYLYISYEDFFIESELYVIKNSEKKDYDNIYQADFYGGAFSVGTKEIDTGYIGNVYERDDSKTEFITNVGVTISDYVSFEIYINPNNDSMKESDLIKIGESDGILDPGYHKIDVKLTELRGKEFAVVVKQKSENGVFYFAVESPLENTAFSCVDSENNSYYSVDGNEWENISKLEIPGIDMKESDVCIKAFTVEELLPDDGNDDTNGNENNNDDNEDNYEEITINSSEYLIREEEIYKIISGTSITDLKENIETESTIKIYDEDEEITEENQIIKTGMKLKLENGKEYILIVRGDINCDGRVSLTDLSKLILHYNETRGYILNGSPYGAADMNYDKKVSLIDVSQMLILYNSI